jgi:hypothetical protein
MLGTSEEGWTNPKTANLESDSIARLGDDTNALQLLLSSSPFAERAIDHPRFD